MALSQLQCLDEGNVNVRTNESKPDFYYSEPQRLALETLLAHGTQAFNELVTGENLREFLSELDIEQILNSVRDFLPEEPDEEEAGGKGEGSKPGSQAKSLSLHYWPETSDIARPRLELGWPDSSAYRGVTRANVYTQPPLDGSMHIKEMIRRMINQAQKVIAVVMDLFTDVDIFKDLLDASFKRRVPVYIIHDEVNIKYFLKMCECSGMHMGMLKNLRVYCVGGTEFHTRSAKTIVGRQMQKFLLIDGDRAACGSYSFTWTASRLDRNVVTVISGQAVETFDYEFRELLHFSKAVNMHELNLAPEIAEPEPVQQAPALTAEQSAAIARKLINPKYALVRVSDQNTGSDGSEKKNDSNGMKQSNEPNKGQKAAMAADPKDEESIIHPALLNMPKVDMFLYLPPYPVIPQDENQQPNGVTNTKERNHVLSQSDTVDMASRIKPDPSNPALLQQKEATSKTPGMSQTQDLTVKESQCQRDGNDMDTENKPRKDLLIINKVIKVSKQKQKKNRTVGKLALKQTESTAIDSTQDKDEALHNSTKSVENLHTDSSVPTYREHGIKQVDHDSEREDHKEDEALTLAMDEIKVVTENNKEESEHEIPLKEADLCPEVDCPSNPSTNYTPDWNTDTSSLHEPSSDSDDFYDCEFDDNEVKGSESQLNKVNDEFTIGEVTNFVSRATFARPSNNYKELSHSTNDLREGKTVENKDVNAFFQERANLRRKALNKLKVTLAINYHDKFQRERYIAPTKSAAALLRSNVDTRTFQPLHIVSSSPDLSKSRRLMLQSSGLQNSKVPCNNYQKAAPRRSVTSLFEQKGLGRPDSTMGLSVTESRLYNNYTSGISMDSDISSMSTTAPFGLSISRLTTQKNLNAKLPVNKVSQMSESTPKALTK
ncbi:protein FAM83G-like [Hemiscyllium ocellatum]|uniref:protein FAM83G-like n=1 Tax=Hemiscyllium ocellatum TaxID=170820 RepID=UPI0029673DB3|nr:protein FAM83G-like [Hemiscyllium ocellatum]